MTNKQDLELGRATYEANLELKLRILESRWKQSNEMTMSYIREFERLGVSHAPLMSVNADSFDTHSCYKYVGQGEQRLNALENSWQKSKQMSLLFMQEYTNRGLVYRSLSVSKDQNEITIQN